MIGRPIERTANPTAGPLAAILAAYCLALCAMFIGAAVQAEPGHTVAPAYSVPAVPLPSARDIAIAAGGIDLLAPISISRTAPDGTEVSLRTVGANRAIVTINGEEIDMIIDYPDGCDERLPFLKRILQSLAERGTNSWVNLSYDRFDVYIEEDFYNSQPANTFEDFFDLFEPRYEYMEQLTGWTSEQFYDQKLEIYVEPVPYCAGGYATHGEANVFLYENISNPEMCKCYYYENGEPYYNNPGELGDNWYYMSVTLHESQNSINPSPIFYRPWITDGFATYDMYNILVNFNDINQETEVVPVCWTVWRLC